MKAMVLEKPGDAAGRPLQLSDLPIPEPGPEEVLLKVSACGVCHTDLHTVEGELRPLKLPVVPGHQIVGEIVKAGYRAGRVSIGQRVGVTWLYSACRQCEFCAEGRENLCEEARFTGLHADGGYAEYAVAHSDYVFALPGGLEDARAAPLLCAGVIGYRSLRLSEIKRGQILGLFGFGASAHITIQIARYRGCRVFAFSRSGAHRRHAMALGAEWAGSTEESPPELLHGAITFAPAGQVVPAALKALRKGGTLAINAVHMSPIPQMDYGLLYHERTLRSVANLTRRDAEEFLNLAAAADVRTEVETYPLCAANAVLQKLKRSEIKGAAVLQVC